MKEILDSDLESIPSNKYSRKACWFFVANLVCVLTILIIGFFFTGTISGDSFNTLYQLSMVVILIFIALGLLGFRCAMLSFTKKEKWTYIKIVGVVGNLLFFILIILLFAANLNDVLKGI